MLSIRFAACFAALAVLMAGCEGTPDQPTQEPSKSVTTEANGAEKAPAAPSKTDESTTAGPKAPAAPAGADAAKIEASKAPVAPAAAADSKVPAATKAVPDVPVPAAAPSPAPKATAAPTAKPAPPPQGIPGLAPMKDNPLGPRKPGAGYGRGPVPLGPLRLGPNVFVKGMCQRPPIKAKLRAKLRAFEKCLKPVRKKVVEARFKVSIRPDGSHRPQIENLPAGPAKACAERVMKTLDIGLSQPGMCFVEWRMR